ncbi:MAG: DUF3592 domain-containing protein [Clostridiales bacterium]|nr:DUF3592 domain-containing protein [Clostridiales bacterium]
MGIENKIARLSRNTGPARFFVPVGLILIVFALILMGFNHDNYELTTGTVTAVTALPLAENENQQYDVQVKYTVDGKDYENTFNNLGGSYTVGGDIKVYYDPDDPEKITNSKMAGFIPPILLVVGAAAVVFGIYKTVTAFKKSKALDSSAGGKFDEAAFEGFKDKAGVREIYVRFDGKALKPGYIVEDADRNVLFEGQMTKQALVGARTFTFINHVTNTTETHEVGHTVQQTYNDGFFTAKSWFKFDGKNVWDAVHELGIRINTGLMSKFPNVVYDIARNGVAFALAETSGKYVHEDEAAQHKLNIPSGNMYYRVWTASDDLDALFLTIFAISETEQAIVE